MREETRDGRHPGRRRRVNQVVRRSEQLIQVGGQLRGRGMLARRGEIRRRLPIEQGELLQLGGREASEAAPPPLDQLFEPGPVRAALFDPA